MKLFTKHFAGQSIVSWVLQIILIWIAWAVKSGQIANNLTTIFGAGIVAEWNCSALQAVLSVIVDARTLVIYYYGRRRSY